MLPRQRPRLARPHEIVGNHRVDERIPDTPIRADLIATIAPFEGKAEPFSDGFAAGIACVATDQDALRTEALEEKRGDDSDGLTHVSLSLGGLAKPVADLE